MSHCASYAIPAMVRGAPYGSLKLIANCVAVLLRMSKEIALSGP